MGMRFPEQRDRGTFSPSLNVTLGMSVYLLFCPLKTSRYKENSEMAMALESKVVTR
jgi:hypothetical protein